MSEHEFSEVITWPFAMTSEEISVWHKASPRMRKHVAALKREIGELQQGLAFFKAIIQAGEPWTYVAQERYDAMLTEQVT